MKTISSILTVGVLCFGLAAFAQNTPQPRGPCQGTPHAWCDRDGDGLCDRTGRPVGEGQRQQGQGTGNGNPGCCGHCRRASNPQPAQPSQPAPAPTK